MVLLRAFLVASRSVVRKFVQQAIVHTSSTSLCLGVIVVQLVTVQSCPAGCIPAACSANLMQGGAASLGSVCLRPAAAGLSQETE